MRRFGYCSKWKLAQHNGEKADPEATRKVFKAKGLDCNRLYRPYTKLNYRAMFTSIVPQYIDVQVCGLTLRLLRVLLTHAARNAGHFGGLG